MEREALEPGRGAVEGGRIIYSEDERDGLDMEIKKTTRWTPFDFKYGQPCLKTCKHLFQDVFI